MIRSNKSVFYCVKNGNQKYYVLCIYVKNSSRLDGNKVDIELEMAALAKNTMQYNALAQMAGYSKIVMVIKEGK